MAHSSPVALHRFSFYLRRLFEGTSLCPLTQMDGKLALPWKLHFTHLSGYELVYGQYATVFTQHLKGVVCLSAGFLLYVLACYKVTGTSKYFA